jgi:hypothetical protein
MTKIKVNGCKGDVENIIQILETIEGNNINLKKSYNDKLISIQNDFYNQRDKDIEFANELKNEIDKQKKEKSGYAIYLAQKNREGISNLGTLVNDINKLKDSVYSSNNSYSHIESLQDQKLAVSNVKNTNDYLIHINDKCLEVSGNKTYTLENCSDNNLNQRFNFAPITNEYTYYKEFKSFPQSTEENKFFPYNLVKSNSTGLCLHESNGNILLNNCQSLAGQKWKGFTSIGNKCYSQK